MIIFNNTTEDEPTSLGMVALSGNRAASAILEDHFADRSVTIDIVLSREKYFKGTKYESNANDIPAYVLQNKYPDTIFVNPPVYSEKWKRNVENKVAAALLHETLHFSSRIDAKVNGYLRNDIFAKFSAAERQDARDFLEELSIRTQVKTAFPRGGAFVDIPTILESYAKGLKESNSSGYEALKKFANELGAPRCFLSGTVIDMWPAGQPVAADEVVFDDEGLILSRAWRKPIEEISIGDVVVSYDGEGRLKPGLVTRVFRNAATHILDFWGTGVTPGHAYLCGEGVFAGQHVPVMDILRSDGAIVRDDGGLIRAATGCEIGSLGDRMVHAIVGEKHTSGKIRVREAGRIRVGTRVILEDGRDVSILDLIVANGGAVTGDGYIRNSAGQDMPFRWTFSEHLPRPEDYILRRSDVDLAAIYQADEWESIGTQLAAPADAFAATPERAKPLPNIPRAFAGRKDAPVQGGMRGKATGGIH